jgi:hypothetical protein
MSFPIGLSNGPPPGGKGRADGTASPKSLQRESPSFEPDAPTGTRSNQAPIATVAQLLPYRAAFDITGADVYPVSYPPGIHTQTKNKDISVVGDVTKKMIQAAGAKPVWMTLQIAWSGVVPSQQNPGHVPRFPTLQQERFMA